MKEIIIQSLTEIFHSPKTATGVIALGMGAITGTYLNWLSDVTAIVASITTIFFTIFCYPY